MGAWALLLLPPLFLATAQAQVCSMNTTYFEVQENTDQSEPLADIYVPDGQQVTLGPSSTPFAFRIQDTQLFLNVTPDYEKDSMLQAQLECRSGGTVVTQLRVFVFVLDVNDNPPVFPFTAKVENVSEDTKVNTIVISETELEAQDLDKDDILFYTLQEVTLGASNFFSLVGANLPALRLDQPLDFYKWQSMTFRLLARDTQEETAEPSHTATATLTLEVQPADLRPPWFLPCAYSDSNVCIQAEYHGAVPTGHTLPAPLILRPGPIHAVDGDQGIKQRIIYSIIGGQDDGTFAVDADSGNLTMTRAVPSPKTFILLVKGEQADRARYSVTRVTIEARSANGSLPRFPEGRYYGTVALGSGAGVPVKDAASPSQPLRIWAEDPEFPDLNSAIMYRITNNTDFRMDGETVLTAALLADEGVFYAEVEAQNTVTAAVASTVVEIQVLRQEEPSTPTGELGGPFCHSQGGAFPEVSLNPAPGPPGSPGPPEPPTSPEAGATASRTTTAEAPRPPGPSQGPSATSSGWGTSPHPPSGTTVRPPAASTPGRPPSVGTSAFLPSASPSGGSTQTLKPGTSQPMSPGPSGTPQPSAGTPEPGGDSTTGNSEPGGSHAEDKRFSVVEMAALGGVLGALLVLALIALLILIHKHYGQRLKCGSGKAQEPQPSSFDNQAFLVSQEDNWAPAPSPSPGPAPAVAPEPEPQEPPSLWPTDTASESPEVARDEGGPVAVRSILTKERRPEGGYKAVWFGEDIGAEADVVVLNTPASDAAGTADSGSEDGSDEGEDEVPGGGPQDRSGAGSTYI